MTTPLYIVAAGAVTSVGFRLATTSAAIRAGVDNFQDTHFVDSGAEAVIGARIPALNVSGDGSQKDKIIGGIEQQVKWAKMALHECIGTAEIPAKNIRIIVLLAENSRPNIADANKLLNEIESMADTMLGDLLESVHCAVKQGSIGCLYGLQEAQDYLSVNKEATVCLLSIDSWLNNASIQYALENERMLTTEKADGFIPGEAAAAVLISSTAPKGTHLLITGVGEAKEPAGFHSDEPCFGMGLGKAIKAALQQAKLAAHQLDMRLANLNGEEYFFNETAYAWSRVLRKPMPKHYQYQQPATRVGDVGAAFGPLLLGYNLHLALTKRHPKQHTLIQLSSSDVQRGAIISQICYQQDA